jgi:hypothetical protein
MKLHNVRFFKSSNGVRAIAKINGKPFYTPIAECVNIHHGMMQCLRYINTHLIKMNETELYF